jgi:2-isopropylmalate synthase
MEKKNYAKMQELKIEKRTWPEKELTQSPRWCAVDLRDGNQALPRPMTPAQKHEYFKLLVEIGFKEIEIGFPSASEDDFNFCRELIEKNLVPDDVVISVLTQSRPHLIRRTVEALQGVKNGVIHQYIASSLLHHKYVFHMSEDDVVKTAVDAAYLVKEGADELCGSGSKIGFEFSPEEFTDSDLDFTVRLCSAVHDAWGGTESDRVIMNLPMTVERRLPNQYADMIELFIQKYPYNNSSVISVHAHNDMGSAVAATEMTLLAGAKRVEGTLLGHGERTGNVDLITIAMNLHYLGIDTGLDFSNMPHIVDIVESVTDIPVHVRHPYSGQLVFTAFSGSHQDAINKVLKNPEIVNDDFDGWKVPYLHIDPKSIGRSFEKYIRINSQSGKGGIAYVMQTSFNIDMPRWVQTDFARAVQKHADTVHREIDGEELMKLFRSHYLSEEGALKLNKFWPRPDNDDPSKIYGELSVVYNGKEWNLTSEGNGPISALVKSLKKIDGMIEFTLDDYFEDSTGHTADAQAICFVKLKRDTVPYIGAGMDPNVNQAAVKAVFSALNRLIAEK